MKTITITIYFLLLTILSIGQEKDFTLSKVYAIQGKYVFYNIEPYDANDKAFYFENKIDGDIDLNEFKELKAV